MKWWCRNKQRCSHSGLSHTSGVTHALTFRSRITEAPRVHVSLWSPQQEVRYGQLHTGYYSFHLDVTHFTSTLFIGQTRHTTTPSEGRRSVMRLVSRGGGWERSAQQHEGHALVSPREGQQSLWEDVNSKLREEKRWSWAGSLWASSPAAPVTNSDQQIWIPVANGAGFCNSQAPAEQSSRLVLTPS